MRRPARITPTGSKGLYPKVNEASSGIRIGYITDVDIENKVASVMLSMTESCGTIPNVPWVSSVAFSQNGGGFTAIPIRGNVVLICAPENGYYVIIGSLQPPMLRGVFNDIKKISHEDSFIEADVDPDNPQYKIRTGNREPVYDSGDVKNKPNQSGLVSRDLHMGDQEMSSPDSSPARLGVYRGGVIRAKASNLSQILLMKFKDLVRIISRNFQLFSDFGRLDIINKEDETSLRLRGASSFKDESHPTKNTWRVRMHAGAGENVLDTIVTDPVEDGEDGDWSGLDTFYRNAITPAGARTETSKETISSTAEKDITIKSNTANIAVDAALNITQKAGVNIEVEAGVKHSTKTVTLETQTTSQEHTSTAYQLHSTIVSIDSGFLSVQDPTSFLAPVILGAGMIVASPTTSTISPPGGSVDQVMKATQFIALFNMHTHNAPSGGGGTTPPNQQIIPGDPSMVTQTSIG